MFQFDGAIPLVHNATILHYLPCHCQANSRFDISAFLFIITSMHYMQTQLNKKTNYRVRGGISSAWTINRFLFSRDTFSM